MTFEGVKLNNLNTYFLFPNVGAKAYILGDWHSNHNQKLFFELFQSAVINLSVWNQPAINGMTTSFSGVSWWDWKDAAILLLWKACVQNVARTWLSKYSQLFFPTSPCLWLGIQALPSLIYYFASPLWLLVVVSHTYKGNCGVVDTSWEGEQYSYCLT